MSQSSESVPRAVFGSCDDGSYELGRIPGTSEDLAASKCLIESPRLIHVGPSLLLHHTDSLIRSQKSNKVHRI